LTTTFLWLPQKPFMPPQGEFDDFIKRGSLRYSDGNIQYRLADWFTGRLPLAFGTLISHNYPHSFWPLSAGFSALSRS